MRYKRLGLRLVLCAIASATLLAGPLRAQTPDHEVALISIRFEPNVLQVKVGDVIRFTNKDAFKHDIFLVRTANRNIVVVPTTQLGPGESTTVQISDPGLFTLYCTIHGGMSALISTTGSFEPSEEEKARLAQVKVLPPIVKTGEGLFWGKAQCHQCHSIADRGDGLRGPNLEDIGFRAASRATALGLDSGNEYILNSVLHPSSHIVEGYSEDMPKVYQPPIDLDADELTAVISYLQSQGGEVDTWAIDIDEALLETQPTFNPFAVGDPERGRKTFESMGCGSCHTVGDRHAVSIGPDFTKIGDYRNWTWLAQSIIDPNAEVGANWHSATVYLKPDEAASDDPWGDDAVEGSVTGVIREKTADKVVLLVGHDRYRAIAADRIDHIEVEKDTRMPNNYTELMTFRQLADVVSYLESLHASAPDSADTGKE